MSAQCAEKKKGREKAPTLSVFSTDSTTRKSSWLRDMTTRPFERLAKMFLSRFLGEEGELLAVRRDTVVERP